MSRQKLDIRSRLIQRGLDAYFQGSYETALNCFQQALEEGPIGVQDPLLEIMSENTLKAWYQLSGIRLKKLPGGVHRTRAIHTELSQAPAIDLNMLRTTRNLQICLHACIESSILLHLGLIDQAEETCDAARESILRFHGENSKEYNDAVLLMVEIQYSRGPKEKAKEWCAQVSSKRLRERFESFIFGKPGPSEASTASRGTDTKACYWLLQAITCGNFPATLFILQNYGAAALRYNPPDLSIRLALINKPEQAQGLPTGDYLTYAADSGSLATMSLLLERHTDLEESSQNPRSHATLVQRVLFKAIENKETDFSRLLLDYGPGRNASERVPPGMSYETCYELWSSDLNLEYGAVTTNPFEHAIATGCYEIFQDLLPDAAINGSGAGKYRSEPPLNIAIRCSKGRYLVPFLLKAGADTNFAFRQVRPLALAIYHSSRDEHPRSSHEENISRKEMVRLLLDAGANVDRSSIIGRGKLTPLEQAREMNLTQIVDLLLDYGATDDSISFKVGEPKTKRTSKWWKRND